MELTPCLVFFRAQAAASFSKFLPHFSIGVEKGAEKAHPGLDVVSHEEMRVGPGSQSCWLLVYPTSHSALFLAFSGVGGRSVATLVSRDADRGGRRAVGGLSCSVSG